MVLALALSTCSLTGAGAQMGGAPSAAAGTIVTPAASFDALLNATENNMMSLVKAMPAEKYSFAPSAAIFAPGQKTEYTGVRTFAALVTHVAQANYNYAARLTGTKPEVDVAAIGKLTEKDQAVAALAASFAYVHQAIATLTPENAFQSVRGQTTKATTAAGVVVHVADEYGQMVEYLRMNGMVPPASEKKM
jgi:uncharacterized damage-inducible protein DinB